MARFSGLGNVLKRLQNTMNQEPEVCGEYSTLVMGPSGAGKTAWLSSLQVAAEYGKLCSVQVRAENDNMNRLFGLCSQTINGGSFQGNATSEVTTYSFSITSGRGTYLFNFLDGPGGAVFGSTDNSGEVSEEYKRQLLALLGQATGLVVCVDICNKKSMLSFFMDFPPAVADAYLANGNQLLPLKRVVFCLTKSDKYFRKLGTQALEAARKMDPADVGTRLGVPAQAITALRNYSRPGLEMGFCWSSVYGFIEKGNDQGRSNYDPSKDALGVSGEGYSYPEVIGHWRPFQIVEPLLFVVGKDQQCVRLWQE